MTVKNMPLNTMKCWENKIAVVTGASSGIGAAIVKDLVKANVIVVGLARRVERIHEIKLNLHEDQQSRLYPLKCDVTHEDDVVKSFKWIEENLGSVDILVNNAGVMRHGNLLTMDTQLIRETLDTNVMGIILCTREAFKIMQRNNCNGHVILINSTAGHKIPPNLGKAIPSTNIYCPSKYSVSAIAEIYRQEFDNLDTKIKITSISPGLTATEIVPDFLLKNENIAKLQPEDVSNCVLYAIGTPENVQIREITIKSIGDQF